jgi:hypothetical protein
MQIEKLTVQVPLLYSNQGHPTLTQYTQGTLNIDIIGVAREQLVWGSMVTDSVTRKALATRTHHP